MDPILRTDLVFNALAIPLDLVAFLAARRAGSRSGGMVAVAVAHVAFVSLAAALALGIADLFGHRFFMVLRLLGMAVFWHLPALMTAMSVADCPRPARALLRIGAVSILAVYLYSYHLEPRWLEVTHHEYSHPRLAVREPVVIAQLSDIQTDSIGPFEIGVFQKLREIDPDLVIYTGDYIQFGPDSIDKYRQEAQILRRLLAENAARPRYGSFAVLGDTEIERPWEAIFEGTAVTILRDSAVTLEIGGAPVNLVGLTTRTARGMSREDLMELLAPAGDPRFDLIVGHSPDFVMWLEDRDEPFLALAGHTHGGQVRLPFLGPVITLSALPRRYADGFSPYGPGTLSVSRGIGMERRDAPRLRFMCRPELRIITLRPPSLLYDVLMNPTPGAARRQDVLRAWKHPSTPIRVGVSTCLLGEKVRFDANHKRDSFLVDVLGKFVEWVPVCPEVEIGMPVPRPPIRLAKSATGLRLVEVADGTADHTRRMAGYSRRRVGELEGMDLSGYVLKKGSPSCGMERVKIWHPGGQSTRDGRGFFAAALIERMGSLPVEEEGRLMDAGLRENFVERLFAFHRLKSFFSAKWSIGDLVDFHTDHKLQLMAHSERAYRALGPLVAAARKLSRSELRSRYMEEFMDALRHRATPRRHANAMSHMIGHFRGRLDERSRAELRDVIEDYTGHLVPLIVPVTLIRHHARRLEVDYLLRQVYLDPHPRELMLRNHV